MTFPEIKHTRIYKKILENNLVEEYPHEVFKLVLKIIPKTDINYYCCCDIKEIIKKLQANEVTIEKLDNLIEVASNQGCLNLNDLI